MSRLLPASALMLFLLLTPLVAQAGDEELCLDCHVPEEDWEGLTAEEVLAAAADTDIKRHADNADFSEQQLRLIVETLLQDQ